MSATKLRKERLKTLNAEKKKAHKAGKLAVAQYYLDLLERQRLVEVEKARLETERLAKDRPTMSADMEAW